jgi:hypothetical protein
MAQNQFRKFRIIYLACQQKFWRTEQGVGTFYSNNNNNNRKNDANLDEMQHTKRRLGEVLKKSWKKKILHGQYIRSMNRQLLSEEDKSLWPSKGDLKAETESEIVAAQDQALNTKYYPTRMLHTEADSKCRLCQKHDETIDQLISAWPILAKEYYVKRHDSVGAQIHL